MEVANSSRGRSDSEAEAKLNSLQGKKEVKVMTEELLTTKELAIKLDASPHRVRSWLRKMHPRPAEEKGRRWHIPDEWVKEIEARLAPRIRMVKQPKVVARVVSQKGTCVAGHKDGNEFVVGDRTPAGMCSWAFCSIFPFATVLQFGGSFPWGKDSDKITIACPEPENPVVFELRRLRA